MIPVSSAISAPSRLPFPSATGRGLRIAVVDSGIHAGHPHISAPTAKVLFGDANGDAGGEDRLGHGTAVMAAIQEKAPAAQYFSLQLFSNSLRTTTPRLLEAIGWAIDNRMDLVNLSLGTANLECRADFEDVIARAQSAGVLLVSAWRAGEQLVLPGALPGVIGVDVAWDLERHQYRAPASAGPFFASGFPRPLPDRPVSRNLFGISFAVANLSGIAARALEGLDRRSLSSLRECLAMETHRLASDCSS
ncbi:MAG TPA: S8 family serine peptidase [Bryobacteraceae bacterium]|nr:S8 family serine peptidase [Bryobacteraceae bacterium]